MPPVKLHVTMSIPGKEPREFAYELDQDRIGIGRDQTSDIQVPLSTVSRAHCVLSHDGREWYLEDLKSTHGTKHNGKPLAAGGKKLLRDGDVIDLAHFRIAFHAEMQRSPEFSVEKTEALARRMVEEVLAAVGSNDAAAQPYLRVMNGPEEGKVLSIGPDAVEAVIGRGGDCEFQVNDGNVSRRHAIVRRDWDDITIEDAGSKNGVLVKGRRITKPTSLRDTDEIMLGALKLTFIDPSARYLGKLDDIAAFQGPGASTESDALDDEGDEGDLHASAADPSADPGFPGEGGFPAEPPYAQASSRGGGTFAAGGAPDEGFPLDDDPDADDEAPPPKGLGVTEIGLIALAAVAVAGLVIGVALAFGSG